jgi:archaellum component FlaC
MEPQCRTCKEERNTPEDLEKLKEETIGRLEKDYDELSSQAAGIRESMEFHQSIIEEHSEPLAELKEDLEELRAEAGPVKSALDEWKDQQVFYEERDRAFIAERDPNQSKLPFEVPA